MKSLELDSAVDPPPGPVQSNPTILAGGGRAPVRSRGSPTTTPAERIVGASVAWRTVLKRAAQVAATETNRLRPRRIGDR